MFYAVKNGQVNGIYDTWELCKEQVNGFKEAQFKKFKTKQEADDYIREMEPKQSKQMETKQSKQMETKQSKQIETKQMEPTQMETTPSKQNETTFVYCDGSCIHNGLPNAKAGIGIYFGDNDPRNVSECIKGNTNNIAELCAMIRVYDYVKGDATIVSDSKYALLCVGSYGKKCESSGWPNIPNKALVKQLYYTYKGTSFKFIHVFAHTNKTDMHSIGNQHADRLAQDSIKT